MALRIIADVKCGVCPHLAYVSYFVLHLCVCPFMQEMSFKAQFILFKYECHAEKESVYVCVFI